MARNKKKIKLTSDYTIIKRSPNTLNGTKYIETEYPTTTKLPYNPAGQIVINPNEDSNFLLSKAIDGLSRRKNPLQDWVDDYEMPASVVGNDDVKDVVTPDLHSLKNFAYYGSAIKLLESSVQHVIKHFPAELYFTDNETTINGEHYCYVENPFEINCEATQIFAENVDEPLRYLTLSINDYVVITSGDVYTICGENSISVKTVRPGCKDLVEGDFVSSEIKVMPDNQYGVTVTFYAIYRNGVKAYYYKSENKGLYTGLRIRPSNAKLNEFYAKSDWLAKVLLCSTTNPLYMATIDTPRSTDVGVLVSKETYIWPNRYDYNPDINGGGFETYLSRLMRLAETYDEYFSDNAWKILTHEAIKGLDWTHQSDGEYIKIDSSKVEALIKIYSKVFDDIKFNIDGLKIANNVNYVTSNSVSDSSLPSKLNDTPFENAKLKFFGDSESITPRLYASESCGYEECDAVNRFIKTIILNSRYLSSLRGTRVGIETMLALLGFDKTQYDINEYVAIALGDDSSTSVKYPLLDKVVEYNLNKSNLIDLDDDSVDVLDGLPLNIVDCYGEDSVTSYVIPWYTPGRKYDGDLYYQMYGGWGRNKRRYITKSMIKTSIDSITEDDTTSFYSETKSQVEVVEDLTELKITRDFDGNRLPIYYVKNIDNMIENGEYNPMDSDEEIAIKSFGTHYFVLENKDLYYAAGYCGDNQYGWRNILSSEYDGTAYLSEAGKELLYQLSLNYANNDVEAHFGNGKYDDGQEYVDRIEKPLKWAVDNNMLNVYNESEKEIIAELGFTISGKTNDNQKCWYFFNSGDTKPNLLETQDGVSYSQGTVIPSIGIDTYNPETGNHDNEIASANSVINLKNIDLTIYIDEDKFDAGEKFVYTVASKYLYYMVPSSSILKLTVSKKV